MSIVLRGARVYTKSGFERADILLEGSVIDAVAPDIASGGEVFDFSGKYILPGFTDVHVHLREPGFSYKETIRTGTRAAARGGYTCLCAMPNLSPVPDCAGALEAQLALIRRDAAVRVLPYGAITVGERGECLSDMEMLAPGVAGFSDDGRGVQSGELMRMAMQRAAPYGRVIAAHCEDESAPPGESEQREAARDIALAAETGCPLHICHASRRETLELVRRGKAAGVNVTCETAPHYLLLDNTMLADDGRYKMNPPIGAPEDRRALLEALRDGTVDMIATDHAPHSAEEKSRGFEGSLSGIVGLETAFPALYTGLVLTGELSLPRLIELLAEAPARRFGLGGGGISPGAPADLAVFDLEKEFTIDAGEFLSLGRSTPFDGMRVRGRCIATFCFGKIVWEDKAYAKKN